jgi:hypothetical protein
MKLIPLTKGKFAKVDDSDFDMLSKYKWHYGGYWKITGYAARRNGKYGETIMMHRVVLNTKDKRQIDHKNGDKLDNRKENLRLCTRSQNLANSKIRINNTSGFKGICWYEDRKKWFTYINCQKKRYCLGYFSSKLDAALAYNKKSAELFGEFAYLNKIQ